MVKGSLSSDDIMLKSISGSGRWSLFFDGDCCISIGHLCTRHTSSSDCNGVYTRPTVNAMVYVVSYCML